MYYEQKDKSIYNSLFMKIIIICAGLLLGLIVLRLFFIPYTVNDNSMKPNLHKGDYVIVSKKSSITKGNIILINSPIEENQVLLKRVLASEGDIISIRNKTIYINNKKFIFKWKIHKIDNRSFPMSLSFRDNMPSIKLKRNEFFVMGDNFDYSFDSRTFGKINSDNIIGKMIYHYSPLK